MLLEQKRLAMPQVHRRVCVEEICELMVPLDDGDCACDTYHLEWTQGVRQHYKLPAMALSAMTYLFFRDVVDHDDGEQRVMEGPFEGEPGMFLNIHVTGYGYIRMAGQLHSIRAGDAYLFDPTVPHGWVNGGRGLARALSYLVPHSLVPQLLACSGV